MHKAKLSIAGCAVFAWFLGAPSGASGDPSLPSLPSLGSATDAHVSFTASGPAGLTIQGTTQDLRVSSTDANVVVAVPLGNLSTGISLRDHHMRDKYLEVGKFPEATLNVARSQLRVPNKGEVVQADVPGSLTLHGQTRPVTVHYEAHGDTPLAIQGRMHIVMTDFGVVVPSYLGVTVKPDIDVTANFKLAGAAP